MSFYLAPTEPFPFNPDIPIKIRKHGIYCIECAFYRSEQGTNYINQIKIFETCLFEDTEEIVITPIRRMVKKKWADPYIKNANNDCSDFKAK